MAFKNRRRSLQAFHPSTFLEAKPEKGLQSPPKPSPLPSPVENVPSKLSRARTTSGMSATGIIRRVSTMFSSRKKTPSHLNLADSSQHPSSQTSSITRHSSSSHTSLDTEEDDIRRPSGLGRAVSITSNRSLPPSPFTPQFYVPDSPFYPQSGGEYTRSRAISSPNLLRSRSAKVSGSSRRSSVSQSFVLSEPPPPVPPIHGRFIHIPEEIVGLIFSHLSRPELAVCAPVSRMFCSVARAASYVSLNLDGLSSTQLEKLVATLASRRDLTDLVTNFSCTEWPSFFILESQTQESSTRRPIQHHDALLTATFTLAFERMSNLSALALPSFEIGLLGRHTAFGLRSLTFFDPTTTDAERKALFTWLDGQTNITTLKFPCLQDVELSTTSKAANGDKERKSSCPSTPLFSSPSLSFQSQSTPPTSGPHSPFMQTFSSISSLDDLFSSATLLPNLSTLHATPTIVTMLAAPFESGISSSPILDHQRRRPLTNVTLNINTTLYGGLRPGALMGALQGVKQLSLRFGDSVDKRTFEKIMGAAGASLGSAPETGIMKGDADLFVFPRLFAQVHQKPRSEGLTSLEIMVHPKFVGTAKGEVLIYKSLLATVPQFKTLSRLHVSYQTAAKDQRLGSSKDGVSKAKTHAESWIKCCPCLSSITLFSDYQWCRP
ncbi:hypothetical protein BJ165DRAFT_374042 [Panaeolus papilionaceus]|nr:hypothetical protein BJ165DRAFT_374042 [Panaeolus papilionaceus]